MIRRSSTASVEYVPPNTMMYFPDAENVKDPVLEQGSRTMRLFRKLICALVATVIPASVQAQAYGIEKTPIEALPDYITRRIVADSSEQTLGDIARQGKVQQGVILGAKTWNAQVPIAVCFFGGGRELRRRIVAVASGWERQGAPIIFDFGDRNDPALCRADRRYDIRIGYTQPGYWSMIGQDSLVHVGQSEESMNLQRFDISPPDNGEFSRVVLHEFGHALGFYHEHQQQNQGCEDQLDWAVVYNYLEGPPNNWSKETVDFNLRSRRYMAGDVIRPFNVKSIMLYTFPINFYRDGARNRCYSAGNTTISTGDAELLRAAYGGGAATRTAGTAALTAAAASFPASERAALNERLTLFKADQATKNQILRIGNAKFTDVDIKACANAPGALEQVEAVTQFLSTEPKIGMLRYRGIAAGPGVTSGITVLADADHPEIADARRLVANLASRFGKAVTLKESPGRDRWLLTVIACS